ncbi:MAG: T9SS type A sorting domain-containing protein [Candidatus Cloacimonetes bacterium]|nr:T9SS type A sorting domain-containing protein [Candidatus Cloacimonadota bacterium]
MKRIIIINILILLTVSIWGWTTETASLEEFVYGHSDSLEYDNWLSHVVEAVADPGYNLFAPYDRQTNGFGTFTVPNAGHLFTWSSVGAAIATAEYGQVDTLLMDSGLPFKLVEFHDTFTGNTYWIIRENLNPIYVDDNGTPEWDGDDERGGFDYGWGAYIINPAAQYPVLITAPHITDDFTTVPVALKAFRETGAYALLLNGVGREALYDTSYGYYSNSFSYCDPTRQEDLPYNRLYQAFCDHLRETFNHRELCVQIHGYDWNRHLWYANCQISAGWGKDNPGIPIRDYSNYGIDIINYCNPYILSANEIGVHPAVHLNDYFGVNCSVYDFIYTNENESFAVNTAIDLPGYRYNRQMVYTCNGWNDNLTFEPFFHIEMDELPNVYPQTNASYYWFYAYDPIIQRFDFDHLFDNTLEYYSHWIEALAAVIPPAFDFDDGDIPPDVTPLELVSQNYDRVELSWEKTNCYDYDSYQILYAEEPIIIGNYEIWDRANDAQLNNSARTYTLVTGLDENTEYFFQARVLDANGNYSDLSNEVSYITSPARLRYEKAVGRDGYINFSFNALYQTDNAGFLIYRKAENETEYSMIDSWQTNPSLVSLNGINNYTYNWSDSTVTNWTQYNYIAASTDSSGNEYWHNYPSSVTPFDIYTIYFEHEDSLLTDEIWFGASPNASSGWDPDYDIEQDEIPVDDYVFAEFFETDWDNHASMTREIEGGYNFDTTLRSWVFRVRSNQFDDNITIRALGNFLRDGRKLYIIDQASGQTVDLLNNDYVFENVNAAWRNFTMYWGNIVPDVDFANPANHIYQAGEIVSLNWSTSNSFLVESTNVYISTPTDYFQIASNLPPFFNQANWIVPEGMLLEEARVIVDLLMIDGDRHQFTSPYQFGTVPSSYTLAVPSGLHLVSNPFIGPFNISQLLGDDATIYTLENGEYIQDSEFFYGNGYLLESIFGHVEVVSADIQGGNAQFDLQVGWNIVPNPHVTGYLTNNLRIIAPDWEMTFAEAVQYDLIESVIYTLDETWREIDYIRPNESFLLFVNQPDLQVKFIPYVDNYNWLTLADYDLKVRLTASQSEGDTDELILALNSLGSESFDLYYDLPEPPFKPGHSNLSFFSVIDSTGTWTQFNQNTVNAYDILNEQQDWDFALTIQQLEEIEFSLDINELPEEVVVIMTIDGIEHDLTREGNFVYTPSTEVVTGSISFVPTWMSQQDDSIIPVCTLLNYPNPFIASQSRSEGINIAFNIPQTGNATLAVYNIRGQKVADLADDDFEAGAHLLNWNLKNNQNRMVASGVYFTRLQSGDVQKFSKMVIIR